MKHLKHLLHIVYCIVGCLAYHIFDYYFEITRMTFKLIGVGF